MLIREDLSSELAIVTRVLAHAGALAPDARVSSRAGEVLYIAGRGIENARMTPYDVIAVRIGDGEILRGEAPDDLERHLEVYRDGPEVRAAIAHRCGILVAPSLLSCAGAALARVRPELTWERALVEARLAGALIGVEP